jgi:cytochrome c-type biogenesis protein CcmH
VKALITLALACSVWAAQANEAQPLVADAAVEQRLIAIAEELRCLVCQNESLAGSRADLALDLRREIRTLIRQGRSDAQIRDFLVSRYGDYVLYRPPVKPITWLLWGGPFALLLGGVAGLISFLRRRRGNEPALSDADHQKAAALLADPDA